MKPSPRLLAHYVDKPITSCAHLLITKKAVDFDYVALDASGLVGGALRLSKNLTTEQRRHKEVGRHVVQGIQQILKRINCRHSLLIALDGAEPLARAAAMRSAPLTRRMESRLSRLPGTALLQAVEDRLVRMMPQRSFLPREVVISGTGVAGSAEEKMAAWALDLACREGFHAGNGQSLALVGAQELYMSALALTPYYNVSSLVQGQGADVRQITLPHMLEWLGLEELATGGASERVAKARTDALFLMLLCQGSASTDLAPVANLRFPALFTTYRKHVLGLEETRDGTHAAPGADERPFLFVDVPGNKLELNLEVLAALLKPFVTSGGVPTGPDRLADGYLELVLQAHCSLCLGRTPDPLFLPETLAPGGHSGVGTGGAFHSITASQLYAHVMFLLSGSNAASHKGTRCALEMAEDASPLKTEAGEADEGGSLSPPRAYQPFFSPKQPLTAAEYTVLCHSTTPGVEAALQLCLNGAQTGISAVATATVGAGPSQPHRHLVPRPETLKRITAADPHGALELVRTTLSYASASRPHHCVCFSPSYQWFQNARTKLWRMSYVDIGARAVEKEIRRVCNAVSGVAMRARTGEDAPILFDADKQGWGPLQHFPLKESPDALALQDAEKVESPTTLKVLTWNVMFDRYSGQPTPLGMPGIDWCSPKRYPVLAKLIAAEDADVVGMQEVEAPFLAYLSSQPWCKERYVISCAPTSPVIAPWGVAMLVRRRRLPLRGITHVNIPAWSGHLSLMPVATLETPRGGPVHVAAAHLLAPFTKQNENARTGQDQALRLQLTKGLLSGEDCIAMGDFNDWPSNEFVMPAETQYRECWPLVHPSQRGYTMDEANTFCKLKIEEIFFGRSDKVFVRSQRLRPVGAHLVGTRSVNEENGNTDAPAYLFPSDHYGVCVTFSL